MSCKCTQRYVNYLYFANHIKYHFSPSLHSFKMDVSFILKIKIFSSTIIVRCFILSSVFFTSSSSFLRNRYCNISYVITVTQCNLSWDSYLSKTCLPSFPHSYHNIITVMLCFTCYEIASVVCFIVMKYMICLMSVKGVQILSEGMTWGT